MAITRGGAPGAGNGSELNRGLAIVYSATSGRSWQPCTIRTPPRFGDAVAVSGQRVVVDCLGGTGGSRTALCSFRSRERHATVPVLTLNNPGPTPADAFGASVAIAGDRVGGGAFGDDTA